MVGSPHAVFRVHEAVLQVIGHLASPLGRGGTFAGSQTVTGWTSSCGIMPESLHIASAPSLESHFIDGNTEAQRG